MPESLSASASSTRVVQLDNAKLYALEDKFDAAMMEDSSKGISEEYADLFVDELQALNTCLCFLCSVNADATEVESFLKLHPESLLLEGACLLPEDSAVYILRQHLRRCKCGTASMCKANRLRVLDLLSLGFETFQSMREEIQEDDNWDLLFGKLVNVEHEVRRLRREELMMRNILAETAFEVRSYREELNEVYRNMENSTSRPSSFMKLACTRNRSSNCQDGGRRNVLEYQVSVASINLKSVEREHAAVLQRIREGRRAQFAILKRAFQGCVRHEMCNPGYTDVAPAPRSPSGSCHSHLPPAQSTSGSGESDSSGMDVSSVENESD